MVARGPGRGRRAPARRRRRPPDPRDRLWRGTVLALAPRPRRLLRRPGSVATPAPAQRTNRPGAGGQCSRGVRLGDLAALLRRDLRPGLLGIRRIVVRWSTSRPRSARPVGSSARAVPWSSRSSILRGGCFPTTPARMASRSPGRTSTGRRTSNSTPTDGRRMWSRTTPLADWVGAITGCGLQLERILEPVWPPGHDRVWGGWGPVRGALLPGTLVVSTRRPAR